MTSVIDHLAELTGHRDREHADALLLDALWELLQPLSVALHRGLGEDGGAPWTTVLRRGGAGVPPQGGQPAASAPDRALAGACTDCLREQRLVEVDGGGGPAVTLLPLQVGAQILGVAELHTRAPLGAALQRTAQAIARLYGNFLALLDYGQRDALTGLFNRKTFDDSFMRVVLRGVGAPSEDDAQAGAAAAPASQRCFLAALDLDHFKRVNDNFGHLIGDEVLMLTARVMRSVLHLDDGLFRFGGEEFVVLLDAPDEAAAQARLERLREAVARHDYPQVGHVTLSIGFTEVRPEDLPTTAMERADRALYRAKDSGRDCVIGPAALAAAGLMEVIAQESQVDFF